MNGDNQINQLPITDQPSKGPMLGIVIIVILIILGGIYILSSRTPSGAPEQPADTTAPTESPAGRDGGEAVFPPGGGATSDVSDLEAEADGLEIDLQDLDEEAAQ